MNDADPELKGVLNQFVILFDRRPQLELTYTNYLELPTDCLELPVIRLVS